MSLRMFFFLHPSCADVPRAILWRWVWAFFIPRDADCLLRSAAFHIINEVGKHNDRCFIWDGKCSGWTKLCGGLMEVQFAKWFKLLNYFFRVSYLVKWKWRWKENLIYYYYITLSIDNYCNSSTNVHRNCHNQTWHSLHSMLRAPNTMLRSCSYSSIRPHCWIISQPTQALYFFFPCV